MCELGKDALTKGQEGDGDLVVAPTDEREKAGCLRVREDLEGKARLADPGRTADEHALRCAPSRELQALAQPRELRSPANQLLGLLTHRVSVDRPRIERT